MVFAREPSNGMVTLATNADLKDKLEKLLP
jgi:hypothetical protein